MRVVRCRRSRNSPGRRAAGPPEAPAPQPSRATGASADPQTRRPLRRYNENAAHAQRRKGTALTATARLTFASKEPHEGKRPGLFHRRALALRRRKLSFSAVDGEEPVVYADNQLLEHILPPRPQTNDLKSAFRQALSEATDSGLGEEGSAASS